MKKYRLFKLVFISMTLSVAACAPLWGFGPDRQTREDFERRVESVFRLQNTMTSEIMDIQSDGSDRKEHLPIIVAEQTMEKNCRDLNEYASRDIEGENKSFFLLKRVENSVASCEAAARQVEALLKQHQR